MTLTALGFLFLVLNRSRPNGYFFDYWAEYSLAAVFCSTIGAVIASRRAENAIGWIFCAAGVTTGAEHFAAEYATYALLSGPGSLPGGEAMAWISIWLWAPSIGLFVFLGLLFPHGRLPTPRWRWVTWLSTAVILLGAVSVAFLPGPIDGLGAIHNPLGLEGAEGVKSKSVGHLVQALLGALGLAAAASVFVRLRRARGEERQQLKWFAYAATVLASGTVLTYTISTDVGMSWLRHVGFTLVMLGIVGIPVAVGMAILKYRLYDIDFIINRTLVYGGLTATVVGLYALVVGGLGTLLQARGNFALSLLAAGLVAVLFQPLRDRLQCAVNRLMYGERDEPYKVLSRLGRRLEAALAPDAVLPTIVETVAQALKLPYAAIRLEQDGEFVTAAEYGTPVGDPSILPLAYQAELIGQLVLAPRAPGEAFSTSDQRLLDDLARQAEVAVYAVRLTADLQRSRERLVTAREEERRRLRRDLHDGLGPTLATLSLKLDAARNLLAHEPAATEALLATLKTQTRGAIADVRRLVYDLRPPALDELGLVSAIREHVADHDLSGGNGKEVGHKDGVVFSVEAPENLPPLPAAVEVACYRIAQEAMTNVARHAKARTCRIRLSIDDELELEIVDDGLGLPARRRAGVGLDSMRERTAELGGTCVIEPVPRGGTRVLARVPLPPSEEPSWTASASL